MFPNFHKYAYLAGPMRGHTEFNFPAFDRAASLLKRFGMVVFNPAEQDRKNGFDPTGCAGTDEEIKESPISVRSALAADLHWLCENADVIVLLDGWEDSAGALAEATVAKALGLPAYSIHEFETATKEQA